MSDAADGKDDPYANERRSKGEKKKKSSSRSRYDEAQPDVNYDAQSDPKDGLIPKLNFARQEEIPRNSDSSTSPRANNQSPRRQSVVEKTAGITPITPRVQKELIKPKNIVPAAPVPVPVPIPVPKKYNKKKTGGEDDYDEDDFEDYEDEFEDYDGDDAKSSATKTDSTKEKVSPAKRIAAEKGSKASQRSTDDVDPYGYNSPRGQSKQQRDDDEPKKLAPGLSERITLGKHKKFNTFNMSTAGDVNADPRAKRLAKLKSLKIFDLQEEKFYNQFTLMPGTQYELYLRLVRATNSTIKQMGVPVIEETVDHEMQTDDILMLDKQIQFCYGDDTDLLNIMKVAQNRKKESKDSATTSTSKGNDKNRLSLLEELAAENFINVGTSTPSSNDKDTSASSLHFTTFLQKSSQLMVSLLEEKRITLQDKNMKSKSKKEQILSPEHEWEYLGTDPTDGANAYISTRTTVALRTSIIQPHILMTAHPYPKGTDSEDLKPLSGLYCIWDMAVPAAPSWLLCGRGQPTSCCMSGAQTYIAMAGTEEGVVHLWDLREAASIHQDKDALDLGITKGIRKPCYSTPCHSGASREIDLTQQHCHPIVQVEPLGSSTTEWSSVVSQFASIDQSGLTILWMTAQDSNNQKDAADTKQDFGLSPWSILKLVRNRILRLDSGLLLSTVIRAAPAGYDFFPVFATIPNDRSTFLISNGEGMVGKLMRYGEAPPPRYFNAPFTDTIEVAFVPRSTSPRRNQKDSEDKSYQSDVTSVSVSKGSTASDVFFILVGRRSGIIDLFQSDESAPIQTWNSVVFERSMGSTPEGKLGLKSIAIQMVRWIPSRVGCFVATDEFGECFFFNLLKNPNAPYLQDNLNIKHIKSPYAVDMSDNRPGSTTAHIAVAEENAIVGDQGVRIRKLWSGLVAQSNLVPAEEEKEYLESMNVWAARNLPAQVKQKFRISNNNSRK